MVLICIFSTGSAFAELLNKKLVLGVVQFPPLVVVDSNTYDCIGPAIDASKTLLTSLGYSVRVECVPAARLYSLIESGLVDITVNVRSTGALVQNVDFVDIPFSYLNLGLVKNLSLEDDKSVAAIRGFDYLGLRNELRDKGFTFFDLPSSNDAVNLFIHERTANLLTYLEPYEYYLKQQSVSFLETKIKLRKQIPTYFAVSRFSKHHDSLIKALNKFAKVHDVGTFIDYFSTDNSD